MDKEVAWIDGWDVLQRPDGSYAVYDSHGMIEGPFGTQKQAMAAALRLPVKRRTAGGPAVTSAAKVEDGQP
jgi:hypothetical protein